jgi:hypothetical protein
MTGRVGSDTAQHAPATKVETGALSPAPPAPQRPTPQADVPAPVEREIAQDGDKPAEAKGDTTIEPKAKGEAKEDAKPEAQKKQVVAIHDHSAPRGGAPAHGKATGGTRDTTTDYYGTATSGEVINGLDDADGIADEKKPADDHRNEGGGRSGGGSVAHETAPPPPPPPPPEPAKPTSNDAAETVTETPTAAPVARGGDAAPDSARAPDAKTLTRQAIAAAKKKDCKTVGSLATRVFDLDEGYYRSTFATDPDIRDNCAAATRK